jgi:protein-tyrosine phosphatase
MAENTYAIFEEPNKVCFSTITSSNLRDNLRRIPLMGVSNFRDLGGYVTLDGRPIRWGALYRSDRLRDLSDRDLLYLDQLDLHTIIDFRSQNERLEAPNRLPNGHRIKTLDLPIIPNDSSEAAQEISNRVRKGDIEGLDALKLITADYRRFVTKYTFQFRQYFRALIEARGRPVLFHCTAGKDRTGFAAATILRILGVPEESIIEDYLLSNRYYLPAYQDEIEKLHQVHGQAVAEFVTLLAEVRAEYIQASFQAIDDLYGSFEAFRQVGLGLDDQDISDLRSYLLL